MSDTAADPKDQPGNGTDPKPAPEPYDPAAEGRRMAQEEIKRRERIQKGAFR